MATVDTRDMTLPVRAIKTYGMVELSTRLLHNIDTRLRLVLTFTDQQLSVLFDLYKNSRHEFLESCFLQVIRDSARLSACIINRTLSTLVKMKYIYIYIYIYTNANESCVCELGRHWKILSKIKVRRSKSSSVRFT